MVKVFTSLSLMAFFALTLISFNGKGQALNGTYIVGTGGNYTTMVAAVTDLNSKGVSGPVVFNIKNGTYTGKFTINQFSGISATNTVTFRGESRSGVNITYAGVSTTDRATVTFNGADYITFRNLTISNTGTTASLAVYMFNNANYNTIDSCDLIVPSVASSAHICFLASASQSGFSSGNNANYTTIKNSLLSGGYYGSCFYGLSSSPWNSFNTVENCTYTNQNYSSMYNYYQADMKLLYNKISGFTGTSAYGMFHYYGVRSIIQGNTITRAGSYGFYIYYENRNAQTQVSYVMNNMCSDFQQTTTNSPIYAGYNYNVQYLHNTLVTNGSSTSYSSAALCLIYPYNCTVKNNILASLFPNGSFALTLYYSQTASPCTVDYNNYYYPNHTTGNAFYGYTTTYQNLTGFKTFTTGINTGHDANSWDNVNPGFYSISDLHIAPTTIMNAPVVLPTGYHFDVDKDVRASSGTTMIGADLVPANDLDIASLTPQMAKLGNNDITVMLQNRGLNTISSSTVIGLRYRVDGGTWNSENLTLTSDLKTGNTVNFTFTTKWNISVDKGYRLTAQINPQISGDVDAVDSFSQMVYIGMDGTYTINPTGSGTTNFTTFNAAVAQLIARGLAGPVIFNVSASTFNERVTIPVILGSSATNTVTFKGTSTTGTILQFTGSSTSDWITLLLNGADYINFRDMSIRGLGSTYAVAVLLTNVANYNKFTNCSISVPVYTSSTSVCAFAISGSTTSVTTAGNGGNYNLCDSNAFSGGYYCVVAYGPSTTSPASGNSFRYNTVKNAYLYGMYLYSQGQMKIEYNRITDFYNPGATTSYGVYNYYGRSVIMNGNIVNGAGYMGFAFAYQNYYFTSDSSFFTNNIVANMTYTTYHYGVYAYYNYNTHYYHNSIDINHGYSSSTSFSGIYAYYNYFCYMKNNIISSRGTSGPCIVRYYGSWYPNSIDYNDLYKVGTNFVYWEGTMYANLASLKAADLNQNQNSWSVNPQFTSTTDLHLSNNSPVMLAPVIIPSYYDRNKKDVDYENRNITGSTFIGADMPPPMTFDSVSVSYIGGVNCFQGQQNAKMIRARIHFKGFADPLSIEKMYFSTLGSTNPVSDITKIHFYKQDGTPLDTSYKVNSTTTVSGQIVLNLPANFTVADAQSIYVSVDLNRNAKIGDTLMITFDSAVIYGIKRYPSVNKAGYAIVVHPSNYNEYCDVTRGLAGAYSIGIKRVRFETIDNSTATLNAGIAPTNTVVQFYPGNIPTLYKKKTYTFKINHGELNTQSLAMFMDQNRDAYFQSTERIRLYSNIPEASITTDNLYIDCTIPSGYHRIRLIADHSSITPVVGCGVSIYGEVEDYLVYIADEETPVVSCEYPDSAYVKGLIEFKPKSSNDGDIMYYWDWDSDMTIDDSTSGIAKYAYQTTGTKAFTLYGILRGCSGNFKSNSITKTITIINPVGKPKVNFICDKNTVTPGMKVKFIDLTTNGAYSWKWVITPDTVLGNPAYTFIPGNTEREPQVVFLAPGLFTVKLIATNVNGADSLIKTDYIEVVKDMNMCYDQSSTLKTGYLYDDGGAANYTNPISTQSKVCGFLINPRCASTITLDFLDFDVNSMIIGTCNTLPGDALRVYDGKNNTATPLHLQFKDINGNPIFPNGFSNGAQNVLIGVPPSVTASSGSMYVEFFVNCAGVGQGFEAKWSTVLKQFSQPVAKISLPDTVYVDQPVNFQSTSIGTQLEFEWDTDGDGWGDKLDSNFTISYSTSGTYKIRLIVNSCDKLDTTFKNLVVLMPATKPIVDFMADFVKVTTKDEVSIIDKCDKTVHTWNWSISPAKFTFEGGTKANSKDIKVKFTEAGTYTVKLVATNAKGSDSLTKTNYITVFNPCIPQVAMLTSDIGISSVKLSNVKNELLINQQSLIGLQPYSDYTLTQKAEVAKGGKYKMEIERLTNFNNTTISVFLDINQNGQFETNEEVHVISNSSALKWSFDLAVQNSYPEGLVRMRIAANAGQLGNKGCGPNISGEFEDYMLVITKDKNKPVITLSGGAKITMNSCDNYVEPGYLAFDEETGDITANVVVTGTINNILPGTYYKKYNVNDAAGNKAVEVVREITVLADIVKPKANLNGKNPDLVAVFNTYADPGYIPTDNCSGVKSHKMISLINTSIVGWQKNMFIVEDNQGNIDTSYRMVYVYDDVNPTIKLKGNATMYVNVFDNFSDPGAIPDDNYDTKLQYTVTGSVNTSLLGTYILSYCVTDSSGNGPVCIDRTVIVEDKEAPVITLKGSANITIDVFTPFTDPGYIAKDNYYDYEKGEVIVYVTGFVNTTKLGTYTIKYKATDASGNVSAEYTRTINVVDRVAPTISLLGESIITLERWKPFNDPGVKLMDNYYSSNELIVEYNKIGSYPGNTYEEGIYTYSYKVCDPSGNCSGEIFRTVNVVRSTSSIGDNTENYNLSLYPNPASDIVNISVNYPVYTRINLSVYNALGEKVMEVFEGIVISHQQQINISHLSSGVYYLQMSNGYSEPINQKFVITR